MSNTLTSVQRSKLMEQRRAWLKARPNLLARLPSLRQDVADDASEALAQAVYAMRQAGLYAVGTTQDIRHGIRRLTGELRGEASPRFQS